MATTKNGIYYPGNYESVADVPADMKKMAESIDNKVEDINTRINGFKNYDDTEIKQDIATNKTNIQANATDILNLNTNKASKIELQEATFAVQAKLEEAREENKRLREDLKGLPSNTAKGEYITLDDSADMNCEIKVFGNSKQETREGYNVLPNNAESKTINGMTFVVNSDKSITVNGTATAKTTLWFNTGNEKIDSGSYYLGNATADIMLGVQINATYYNTNSNRNIELSNETENTIKNAYKIGRAHV